MVISSVNPKTLPKHYRETSCTTAAMMNGGGGEGEGERGGSSFNSSQLTPNLDNRLLQSMMSRLQLRPSNLHAPPAFSDGKSLVEMLISDILMNLSDADSESDSEKENPSSSKSQLAKEESKVEKEIVRTILGGEIEKLKPNSGQTITIGEHHICVGFQEETGSDYRVWEWHGHIMLFDEENGYTPEYIYGNYFERIRAGNRKMKYKTTKDGRGDEKETNAEKVRTAGLKELIEVVDSASDRILHRNLNANSFI